MKQCLLGSGMYENFDKAIELTVENRRFHEPNPEYFEAYQKGYEIYK